MRIVVTGAEGQLGGELLGRLPGEVIGLDLPEFDLTDRGRILAVIGELRPTAVINTAAYTRVDQAEREPELCHRINALGVGHLAEACRAADSLLVQISTDHVFGGDVARHTPYRETDPPAPQGVYARTKLDGERLAAQWERHLIVRTCGLYGRRGPRSAGNFVDTILRLAREGKRLRVVDDQVCSPSYVPDVAAAIGFLVASGATGLYHVESSGATTWFGMAERIVSLLGIPAVIEPITTGEYGALAPRPAYSVLDTAKYLALPGCSPLPPWQEALARYLAEQAPRRGT